LCFSFTPVIYLVCIVSSTLRQGMHDLKVWSGVEADGAEESSTPGKSCKREDRMSRITKVINYTSGIILGTVEGSSVYCRVRGGVRGVDYVVGMHCSIGVFRFNVFHQFVASAHSTPLPPKSGICITSLFEIATAIV